MAEFDVTVNGKYLTYRGLPLVREGNTICYGSMEDKYVLFLMILSEKTVETAEPGVKVTVPDSIMGKIISTDPQKKGLDRVAKSFTKKGLYEALDMGIIQLERFNK